MAKFKTALIEIASSNVTNEHAERESERAEKRQTKEKKNEAIVKLMQNENNSFFA